MSSEDNYEEDEEFIIPMEEEEVVEKSVEESDEELLRRTEKGEEAPPLPIKWKMNGTVDRRCPAFKLGLVDEIGNPTAGNTGRTYKPSYYAPSSSTPNVLYTTSGEVDKRIATYSRKGRSTRNTDVCYSDSIRKHGHHIISKVELETPRVGNTKKLVLKVRGQRGALGMKRRKLHSLEDKLKKMPVEVIDAVAVLRDNLTDCPNNKEFIVQFLTYKTEYHKAEAELKRNEKYLEEIKLSENRMNQLFEELEEEEKNEEDDLQHVTVPQEYVSTSDPHTLGSDIASYWKYFTS